MPALTRQAFCCAQTNFQIGRSVAASGGASLAVGAWRRTQRQEGADCTGNQYRPDVIESLAQGEPIIWRGGSPGRLKVEFEATVPGWGGVVGGKGSYRSLTRAEEASEWAKHEGTLRLFPA